MNVGEQHHPRRLLDRPACASECGDDFYVARRQDSQILLSPYRRRFAPAFICDAFFHALAIVIRKRTSLSTSEREGKENLDFLQQIKYMHTFTYISQKVDLGRCLFSTSSFLYFSVPPL